jgi:hypothetical protein
MAGVKKRVFILGCLLVAAGSWGWSPSSADQTDVFTLMQRARSRGPATFTHKRAEHAKLSCNTCHNVTPQRIEVTSFPGHTTCIGCHNFANEVFTRGVIFCGVCHAGGPTSRLSARLFDFKERTRDLHSAMGSDFGIDFSHPSHRKPLPQDFVIRPTTVTSGVDQITLTAGQGAKCTDCHQLVKTAQRGERELTIEKGHSTCFQCHGMKPETGAREKFPYMNDCRECHEIGGPKATNLARIREFSHWDHDYDIRPRRKAYYRETRPPDHLCVECHKSVETAEKLTDIKMPTSEGCASCHNGRIGLPDALASNILDQLRQ